jgi:hypothetical protein
MKTLRQGPVSTSLSPAARSCAGLTPASGVSGYLDPADGREEGALADHRERPVSRGTALRISPERRLAARDVPAMRVAGGAPITPICAVLGQLVINRPCEQNGGSLRTGRGLPRSLSVIGMLARRVPYRLGAVDNGSAWMGDVVQDRPVMARFPRGLRPEAEKQLSGGAIRRAIGRRAMMPSARGWPHTLV